MSLRTFDSVGNNALFYHQKISEVFIEHRSYLAFCFAFYAVSYLFLNVTVNYSDPEYFTDPFWHFVRFIAIFGGLAFAIRSTIKLVQDRPKTSPVKFLYKDFRYNVMDNGNLSRILMAAIGLSFALTAFLNVKGSIPLIVPFTYDASFEYLDRYLHFGYQPWQILQPFLGYEYTTLVLHRLYYIWFPVIFVTFIWQAASRSDPHLRKQFLITYVACWALIGGVMATILSSAGPIFFERVNPDLSSPYQSAMAYLLQLNDKHNLHMFRVSELLWRIHQSPQDNGLIRGISAMPSMHVSIAFLLALFGWKKHKLLGIAYTIYFALIFLGSVHLLWHYAIDGYVSIAATYLIWKMTGIFIQKRNVHRQ